MHAYLKTLVVIAIAVELVPTDAQAQEISRIAGTWVLNRAASTFFFDATRSEVRTYEDRGDGVVRVTIQVVRRGGDPGDPEYISYTARHDGSEYRMVIRPPRFPGEGRKTIAFTPVDAYTSDWVVTRNGVRGGTGRSTVSRDGLTYTETTGSGTVRVFDRREN